MQFQLVRLQNRTKCMWVFSELVRFFLKKNGILSKNCSSVRENILKFEAEFAKNFRSQEQFIKTVKGQNNYW